MEIEQLEIRDFLQRTAPLDKVELSVLDQLSGSIEIAYKRSGETILQCGEANDELFLIRSGAVEIKDNKDVLCDKQDIGSWFGFRAILGKGYMIRSITAIEDCLLYVISGDQLRSLLSRYEFVQQYFNRHTTSRLHGAVQGYRENNQTQLMSSRVCEISRRPALLISPQMPIKKAARKMSRLGRTSLLVGSVDRIEGIITEREFCKRVVATGLDSSLPVAKIMTPKPITISAETPIAEALLTMAQHNIHHLPFVAKDNASYFVVTAADLIQYQSHNPLFLINDINNATKLNELVRLSQKLPELFVDLVRSSLTAYDVGHLISSIGTAITQRLLQLAEKKLGTPPVAYAWVAAGSLARSEQTVHSDQDNALILADEFKRSEHDEYFKALAQRVSDGLHACGYIYCPGNVMASNKTWRARQSKWRKMFNHWIMEPEKKSLMYASIFFDLKCLYGDTAFLDDLIKHAHKKTRGNQPFLANLTANALRFRPPIGIFRQFVLRKSGAEQKALNLKESGVVPVADLARVYALSAGLNSLHTQDRLQAAATAGELSQSGMADLIDAYEFIGSVRLEHQRLQIEQGQQPDNYVSPDLLSSFERRHLKDAFDVVTTLQSALKQRYL